MDTYENPQQLNVTNLAEAMGMSERSLRRRMHQTLNTTPKAFIDKVRLERAKYLLRNSTLPVGEIAERVGYLKQESFAKWFRKHMEQTPSEYRHQAR